MKVLINNEVYNLTETEKFGGEGDLYTVNYNGVTKCVKIYYPEKRTPYNERKIITLINKFKKISLEGIENHIAFPEFPVYEVSNKKFCGFLMKYFDRHIQISDLKFSSNHLGYGNTEHHDEDIFTLFDDLFFYLKVLHRAGIILGDINPENILIEQDTLIPCITDFDSVQIGSFYSNSDRRDYIDPSVKVDGIGKHKYFIYTTDSDIYSMATIFYEQIVGPKPHFFSTKDPTDTDYKKNIGLSFLDVFIQNEAKIKKHQLEVLEDKNYRAYAERLSYLQEFYPNILNYLKSVFIENNRFYFYYKQIRPVTIKKMDGILQFKEIELISQPKEDPEEIELFVKQFGINLF